MLETIKLAKQYKLEALFKACETHFKELMVQSFDCTNLITLKSSQMNGGVGGGAQRGRKLHNEPKEDVRQSSSHSNPKEDLLAG